MADYRTLVIAPTSDLAMVMSEVQQVVNLLGAKMLQGPEATLYDVLQMLAEPFDIVWFATHGDEKGIYLSDGLMSTSEITTMIRASGAQLTVLNTCSSRNVALAIHDELQTDLVCTVKPVPDRMAFITATVFARKLAEGHGFFAAYELAKPGQNSTYAYLGEKGNQMPSLPKSSDVGQDIVHFAELVRRLEVIVNGSPQWNVEGLVPAVKRMEAKIDALTVEVAQQKGNQRTNRRLLITLSCISFLLLIAVIALAYMMVGGR